MFPFPFLDSFEEAIMQTVTYVGIAVMSVSVLAFFVVGELRLIEKAKWKFFVVHRIRERFFDKYMR